ncbi:MAG: carboxymuconolactone decarboxylase family protein [Myxococcota bacterium]|nr:carboxymuconolactone decarboxylase family protein [Myxococcota bacterium]
MSQTSRRERGAEMMKQVYAGDVVVPPEGASAFADLMLEQLFAEVWTREALPVRDRRLLVMGVIAALGEPDTWKIQVRAALKNGELSVEQVREVLIHLAQYAGYPRAAGLLRATEEAIAAAQE